MQWNDLKQQLTTRLLRDQVKKAMNLLNSGRFEKASEAFTAISCGHSIAIPNDL